MNIVHVNHKSVISKPAYQLELYKQFIILSDFFDSGVQPSSTEADEAEGDKTMANKLPEGFFDDAKLDAKVT